MAEGDIVHYNLGKKKILDNEIDWLADTIKVALYGGYTPDYDTHEFIDDVTTEISVSGYTAGGETLASKTTTVDTVNDRVDVDAANPSWPSLGAATVNYAVIYKDTGTPSTSPVIATIEIATNPTGSGAYSINFDAVGVFTLT